MTKIAAVTNYPAVLRLPKPLKLSVARPVRGVQGLDGFPIMFSVLPYLGALMRLR